MFSIQTSNYLLDNPLNFRLYPSKIDISLNDPIITQIAKNIFVITDKDTVTNFSNIMKDSIKYLRKGDVGRRLLKKICESSAKIFIKYSHSSLSSSFSSSIFTDFNGQRSLHVKIIMNHESLFQKLDLYFLFIRCPAFIVLGHELIHAYRFIYQKNYMGPRFSDPRLWPSDEEYATVVGIPRIIEKSYPQITENAIRDEHRLIRRWSYAGNILTKNGSFMPFPLKITFHDRRLLKVAEVEVMT